MSFSLNVIRLVVGVLVTGCGLTLCAQSATACPALPLTPDDALIASPANHTLLFENADIRVLDVHSKPHTREAIHTHAYPSVMYFESSGAGSYNTPEGSRSHPTDPHFKPGVRALQPEGPHWTENTGEVPFHAVRVEFKHPACAKPAAQPPMDPAAPKLPGVLLDNPEVRVLDLQVAPHQTSTTPLLRVPGIFYVAQASQASETLAGTTQPVPLSLPAGTEIVSAPATLTSLTNTGDTPLHLILFQLKNASPVTK